MLLDDGTNSYIYGPDGSPIEQITGNDVLYFNHDQQGSTRLLTDGGGAVVGSYDYDPHGNVVNHTGVATSLQYDGEYRDAETGFVYLRARYYDPSMAQFITVDPLNSVTHAPYVYAGNDPLNTYDPTGLSFWSKAKVGLSIVGTGLGIAAVLATGTVWAPVLGGAAIIAGGVAAGVGLGMAVGGCFQYGFSSNKCGRDVLSANLETLYTAGVSAIGIKNGFLDSLKKGQQIGIEVVESEGDIVWGFVADKFATRLYGQNC